MTGPEHYGTVIFEDVLKQASDIQATNDRLNEMIETKARRHNEWIEREVLGAWMAGYDYLHHAKRPVHHSAGAKERCYPSNSEKPKRVHRRYGSSWTVRTYDLRWLFPDDVEAWRDGDITLD